MGERLLDISLRVNGEDVRERVEVRKTLVDFLRDDLGLTGSHIGCEQGVCGACTVLVDGDVVRGCLVLAAQCDGAEVETIEGVSDSGAIADLQEAFTRRNALQCGFCTPGMLIGAQELLSRGGVPSRDAIREHISGNYCRCTGYQAIVDAIEVGGPRTRAGANKTMKIAEISLRSHRARPAEFLYRPLGAAAQSGAADARARPICHRRRAAAHGACRLRALAARPCADQKHRGRGRKEIAGRHRRRHRRRACQGDHALGRRAHPSQRHQIGAAICHRRRSRLLAGRSGVRRRRPQPRRSRGRLRADRGRLRGACRPWSMRKPRSMPRRR